VDVGGEQRRPAQHPGEHRPACASLPHSRPVTQKQDLDVFAGVGYGCTSIIQLSSVVNIL